MSFPSYGRGLSDVSFSDLAKYANNDKDSDVELVRCSRDIDSSGAVALTDVSLAGGRGHEKETGMDQLLGGTGGHRKARVKIKMVINVPLTTEQGTGNRLDDQGNWPSVNPFGSALTLYGDFATNRVEAFATLELTTIRMWMWAEEDSLEAPATSPANVKADRLMIKETVSGTQVGDEFIGAFPLNNDLSLNGLLGAKSVESSYNNDYFSQDDVYGVPEGFAIPSFTITHRNNLGSYRLWMGMMFVLHASDGWDDSSWSAGEQSLGQKRGYVGGWNGTTFSSSTTHVTNFSQSLPIGRIRDGSLTYIATGLENWYKGEDTPSGSPTGKDNNADFKIEVWFTFVAYRL